MSAQANPFAILVTWDEERARIWLRQYLRNEPAADHAILPPPDLDRAGYLEVTLRHLEDAALPRVVAEHVALLLAEAVAEGRYRSDEREREYAVRLLAILSALPHPEASGELLGRLAASGVLRGVEHHGDDLHALVLRALVLNQVIASDAERQLAFWRREMDDVRYVLVAFQGLLRVSPLAAVGVLPRVMRAASMTGQSVVNILFDLAEEIGSDEALWRVVHTTLRREGDLLDTARAVFHDIGLPKTNSRGWALLHVEGTADVRGEPFSSSFLDEDDVGLLARARARLPDGGMLEAMTKAA
jgi:hypothetical protein